MKHVRQAFGVAVYFGFLLIVMQVVTVLVANPILEYLTIAGMYIGVLDWPEWARWGFFAVIVIIHMSIVLISVMGAVMLVERRGVWERVRAPTWLRY